MRSSSSGRAGPFAAALVVCSALLTAVPAHAQRALTNTNSGNDPPPARRDTNALVACSVRNTAGLLDVGRADACLGLLPSAESTAPITALIDSYNMSAGLAYTLALSAAAPDRQTAGGPLLSSGGLFEASGLGVSGIVPTLKFLREDIGSFVFAYSGVYSNAGTNGQSLEWSGYYLFDDVITNFSLTASNLNVGQMPFRAFQEETFLFFGPNGLEDRPRWAFTEGIVLNQISVYRLNRVPEPATWALVALALVAGFGFSRRRTGRR